MTVPAIKVLLVEDNSTDALLVSATLESDLLDTFAVTAVERLNKAQTLLEHEQFDIILLDLGLPDSQGLETFRLCNLFAPNLPIIVFSGNTDEQAAVQAVRAGAQDYLVKGQPAWDTTARAIRYAIERNRTQKALRESEERYRNLVENMNDIVMEVDTQGNYCYISPNYSTLSGYSAEDEVGSPALAHIHPDDIPLLQQAMGKILDAQRHSLIYRVQNKDGEWRWLETSGKLYHTADGTPRIISVARDITERKRMDAALNESEERHRQISTLISDYAYSGLVLPDGFVKAEWVSGAFERITGYAPDEINLLPAGFSSLVLREDVEMITSQRPAFLKKQSQTVEYRIRRKDGEIRWLRDYMQLVARQHPGETIRITGAVQDITERKLAEIALKASEENYRNLVENSESAVAVIDRDGRILYANPYGISIWNDPQVIGKTIFDIYPNDYANRYSVAIKQVIDTQTSIIDEVESLINGKSMWFRLSMSPLKNSDGTVTTLLLNAWDLTERRQAEGALRQSEEQYRYLFKNNPHPMWAYDLETMAFLAVNDAAVDKYGYSREEFLKMTIADIRPPEEVQRLLKHVAQPRPELQYSGGWRHKLKNGAIINVEISSHTMEIEGHHSALVVALDITESKRAEEQIRRRVNDLEALYENGLAIGSLMDTRLIAEKVIEILKRKLDWHHATIRLYNPAEKKIEILAFNHTDLPESERASHIELLRNKIGKIGKGISGWVLEHGETVLSNDVRQDKRYIATYPGIISGLYVPLKLGEVVIGSISAESTKTNAFNEDDQRLLETIASQASIAIENAQLYLKVQQELLERVQAQENLRQSERHLRAILQATSDGFWVVDAAGKFLDVNDAYCQMSGYDREEFLQLNVSDIEALGTASEVAEHFRQIMQIGNARFESRHRRKDGSIFDVEIGVNRLDDELICFCHDITSRKLAEQEIRQVNERFTEIANNILDIFWVANPETGKNVYVSPAFEPVVGLNYETVENLPGGFMGLVLEEDRHVLVEAHAHEDIGMKTDVQYRIRRPDGSIRWIRDKSSPVMDKNGKVVRVVGVARDMTEQVEAEMRLRESEARFRMIAETIDEVFWMTDIEINTMVYVSPGYERIWGRTLESLYDTPMSFIDAVLPEERERVLSEMEVQKVGAPFSHEYHVCHTDGSIRTIWDRGYPVSDEHGKVTRYVGVAQDITARKLAEEERQTLIQALSARTADLVLLLEAGHALSESLDRQQIYAIIYRYVKAALPCDMLVVSSFDPKTELISCAYLQTNEGPQDVSGFPPIPIEPPGHGTQSRAIRSGESLLLPDYVRALKTTQTAYFFTEGAQIIEEPPNVDEVERTRSAIIVPLKVDSKVVGAMQIFSFRINAHTEDHLRFVETLAFHISAALSNARLFGELEQRVQERTAEIETIRQRLELATKAAELGVWDWNISTGELLWDEQMSLNYGIEKKAFQGTLESFMSIVHPEDVTTLMDFAQNIADEITQNQVYYRVIRGDGSMGYIKTHGIVLRDESGQPQHVIGVTQDITQEKLAELALQESEETYRALFENANDAIFLIEPQRKTLVRVNSRCEELLGYTTQEMVGHLSLEFISPSEVSGVDTRLEQLLAGEYVPTYERKFRCKDGSVIDAEVNISLIRDENRQPKLIQNVVRDITDRKLSERALRESEEQNRLLFEESPDAVTLLDTTGKIIRANRAYEQLVKIPLEKILGKSDEELGLVTSETRQELLNAFQHSLEIQDRFATSEYVLSCGDGSTRNVESRIFWLIFNGLDHILITSRDVTLRKKAEETLRLANAELERALRLKDEFLANMSHELRTPLNAILGISESLEEKVVGPLNDKQQHYIRTISESGRHLLALINDILDLSKIEAGRMDLSIREVNVETLVQSSLRMIKELATKKKLNVILTLESQVQTVDADERRLKQVLVNLLSNAVKFTPENGRIGLEVSGNQQTEQVTFTVWDTGIGIEQEDIPRLFHPFVQLDSGLNREHAGTGLGLALVSEIIRLHGGRVGVQSVPNEGSRFFVVLPWRQEKKTITQMASANVSTQPLAPTIRAKHGKVLLVEDTEAVTLFVNDYLQALGYQVIIARDGLSGVSEAKNHVPDLILMDIQMPGMDGFDATREIRNDPALREIPIIALTAMAMPGDRERCLEAGMQDYLSKPISLKQLAQMIHEYLLKSRRKIK